MIGKEKSQLSILDSVFNRRKKKSRLDHLLKQIDEFVDWRKLERIVEPIYKNSRKGRPTVPIIYSIKSLFLQYLYDLSDPQLEDALIDRLSFQRFLGLSFEEEIPDFTTIWRFRERLIKADILDKLFDAIIEMLEERHLILRRGTIVDATIVQSARKPKKKDRREKQKEDKTEEAQSPQEDKDARFTRKNNRTYYGYKGHIGIDEGSHIIRKARFTAANRHDSQEFDQLISGDEKSVFADKAYDNQERKRQFRNQGIFYGIIDKGRRNHPLSGGQKKRNKKKSKIRSHVERVFAHFKHHYGYRRARYVNMSRNELHFKFLCMLYNVRRGIVLTIP